MIKNADYSGATRYFTDRDGNVVSGTVANGDVAKMLQDKSLKPVEVTRFADSDGKEYSVPNQNTVSFLTQAHLDNRKVARIERFEDESGDWRDVPMFEDRFDKFPELKQTRVVERDGKKVEEPAWKPASEWMNGGLSSLRPVDKLNIAYKLRRDSEMWGVSHDENGDVKVVDSAAEIAERAVRGTVAAVSGIASGVAGFIGDAIVDINAAQARPFGWAAEKVGVLRDGATDDVIRGVRSGWEGVKSSVRDGIIDNILGDMLTNTDVGRDLANMGMSAAETYGGMSIGLGGVGKAGQAIGGAKGATVAVGGTFGVGGFEHTKEDVAVQQAGLKGDAVAIVKGAVDAVAGHYLGKVLAGIKAPFAGKAMEQTLAKAVGLAVGETLEGGLAMAVMQGAEELGKGIAGIGDVKKDENGNVVIEDVPASVRFQRVMNALEHGLMVTAGLKMAELAPRTLYGAFGTSASKAVTYNVEMARKTYAPHVEKLCETARMMADAHEPIVQGKGIGKEVRAVTTNGEVVLHDGSIYYPPTADRTVTTEAGTATIKGREARIVVSDGTILNAKGDVVGKLAGGQMLGRSVDTVAETYVRANDAGSGNEFTIIDPNTGTAGIANVLDVAPEGFKAYRDWLVKGQTFKAPELDADTVHYMRLMNRYRMGGDIGRAAELALGDVHAGRKTMKEAAEALDAAERQFAGERVEKTSTKDSSDSQELKDTKVVNPTQGRIEVNPGTPEVNAMDKGPGEDKATKEISKKATQAAAEIVVAAETGEMVPSDVDLANVVLPEAVKPGAKAPEGTMESPVIMWENPETGKLEIIDGNKRVASEAANGSKSVKAVVLRASDGWTRENAEAVGLTANLRDGTLDAAGMVDAYKRLGVDLETALFRGILVEPGADAPLEQRQKAQQQRAALNIAMWGSVDLRANVNDGNLMKFSAIVDKINVRTWGDGWREMQRELAANLDGVDASTSNRALEMTRNLSKRLRTGKVTVERIVEVAKYAESVGLLTPRNMMELYNIERQMAEDPVLMTPVEQPDGTVKTLTESESGMRSEGERYVIDDPTGAKIPGTGTVEDLKQSRENNGIVLEPIAGSDGLFGCARFPALRVEIDGDGNYRIDGITPEDVADPRNQYDFAKMLGRLSDRVSSEMKNTGRKITIDMPADVQLQVFRLLDMYEREIAKDPAAMAHEDGVLNMLEKSGLAAGVVTNEAEFNAALSNSKNGRALVADGLTYGFTDGDKVFLNPKFFGTKEGLNTKIHEFGHLGIIRCKTVNRAVYDRGIELAGKMTEQLDALRKTAGYDTLDTEKLKQEILARIVGNRGEELIRSVKDRPLRESIITWVKDFWKAFGSSLGLKGITEEQAKLMTVEDVCDAINAEMLSGKKFGEYDLGRIGETAPAVELAKNDFKVESRPANAIDQVVDGGTTVAGSGRNYSIRSLTHDLSEGKMIADLVKQGIFTAFEAKEFERNLNNLVDKMIPNRFILDINENFGKDERPFNPYKPNSDPLYKISLDFSTLCKKRLLTQYVIENLQMKMDRVLQADEQFAVRSMLLEYKQRDQALQVACHLCYVEAARLKAPKQINRFFNDPTFRMVNYFAKKNSEFSQTIKEKQERLKVKLGYSKDTPKREMTSKHQKQFNDQSAVWRQSYKPSTEEKAIIKRAIELTKNGKQNFLVADKLANLLKTDPEIFRAYTDFVRESTHSKGLETDVPYYYGDAESLSEKFIGAMNEQGTGMRHQSWSDFQMRHLLDTIVAVCDLSVKNAKMHAYTKVPAFAECFGKTGIMTNLSLIPDLDGAGWSSTEGMEYAEAIRLRDKFPETCGTIAIAINDQHLIECINNPYIDYCIPYHSSGLNKGLRKMVGIDNWNDFTKIQHEKKIDGAKNTRGVEKWQESPEQGEWLVREGDGAVAMRKSAEKYLNLCNERGLVPKFAGVDGLLKKDSSGRYRLVNHNYWKLLVDHKMINQKTGKLIDQRPVRPVFDFEELGRQIDAEVGGFDKDQFENAYKFVEGKLSELPSRVRKLKKSGEAKRLLDMTEQRADSVGDGDVMMNRGTDYDVMMNRGGSIDRSMFVFGRARVADDAGRGEQLPGPLAASRELATQGIAPMSANGRLRQMSLPISEMEWLRKALTGDSAPAQVARRIEGGNNYSANNKSGKLVIAADIFGTVDKTDMAQEKTTLVQHGFFRNENPTWCASKTPADIRAERERSEQQLATNLLGLADRRAHGAPGGQEAARGVFADELAKIIMDMPGVPTGGVLGQVRTIGQSVRDEILNRFSTVGVRGAAAEGQMKQAAGDFLDWAYGQQIDPATGAATNRRDTMSLKDMTSAMFGAFLVMPAELGRRAPRWHDAIVDIIGSTPKLENAFRDLTIRSMSEQSAAAVMEQIRQSQKRQAQEAIAKLVAEGTEPIKPANISSRILEPVVVGFHDKLGPVAIRIDDRIKTYLAAQKAALKAATSPAQKAYIQQQIDLFMGNIAHAKNQMNLSRIAMERGGWNEGRRYFMKMLLLENEASERWGLSEDDRSLFLDMRRVIETQGRASSFGQSVRQAQLTLDAMQRRLGSAKWAKLEEYARKFFAIHEMEILNDARLELAFGKEFVDYCRTQESYVSTKRTWSPEELQSIEAIRRQMRQLGVRGGDDVISQMFTYAGSRGAGESTGESGWTARLVGSMAAKQEVRSATWEKMDRLMQFVRRNKYVIDMRDALVAAGVKGVSDHRRTDAPVPENDRYGRINYLERGQKRTLVVPRQIADGFKRDADSMKFVTKVNGFCRSLYIDYNVAYWNRNINRNLGSIEKNMPGMHESWAKTVLRAVAPGLSTVSDVALNHIVRHLDEKSIGSKALRSMFGKNTPIFWVPKAGRMAKLLSDPTTWQKDLWAAQDAGDIEKFAEMQEDLRDALEMLKANMLVGSTKRAYGGETEGFANDIMNAKGFKMLTQVQEQAQQSKTAKILDSIKAPFKRNQEQQNYEDVLAKTIAYLHDRYRYGLERTVQETGATVAGNVSIGQGERSGTAKRPLQGFISPFFNMIEKGVVRHWKAIGDRPGETLSKDARVWMGRFVGQAMGSGLLSALILWMNDGDDEKARNGKLGLVYRYGEYWRYAAKNLSSYVLKNYMTIPIWTSESGYTTVVIGLPLNDEDKLVTPTADLTAQMLAHKYLGGARPDVAGAVAGSTYGAVVPDFQSASPALTILHDTVESLAHNPQDLFRGTPKYDPDLYAVRGESPELAGEFAAAVGMQLWDDLGGRAFIEAPRNGVDDGQGEAPKWLHQVLSKIPVVSPVLKSFIKIQVGSPEKDAKPIKDEQQRRNSLVSVLSKDLMNRSIKDGAPIYETDPSSYEKQLEEWHLKYGLNKREMEKIQARLINGWNARQASDFERDKKVNQYLKQAHKLGIDEAEFWLLRGEN